MNKLRWHKCLKRLSSVKSRELVSSPMLKIRINAGLGLSPSCFGFNIYTIKTIIRGQRMKMLSYKNCELQFYVISFIFRSSIAPHVLMMKVRVQVFVYWLEFLSRNNFTQLPPYSVREIIESFGCSIVKFMI